MKPLAQFLISLFMVLPLATTTAFTSPNARTVTFTTKKVSITKQQQPPITKRIAIATVSGKKRSLTHLNVVQDLEVVSLVIGQENYGLAIVALGEAIWSFLEAPSLGHARVFIPAAIAAVVLVFVSGPMVTSGEAGAMTLGLEIATFVSVLLGASYVARLLAPYSPSAKEIAFGGLLVALAGFFSFSQNLLVNEFVRLPSIPLPTLPSIELPF